MLRLTKILSYAVPSVPLLFGFVSLGVSIAL
jgi:hypothetical protein